MGRIEKTVFISYRRTDEPWGLAVFQDLTQHGYDVFIDYDGIASGDFEAVIFENIRARAHFLVLLTPTALERCGDPKDWMRREIEAAIDSKRNIVPLMFTGFDFGAPATVSQLAGKLAALKQYNGLPIPKGYFSSAMERLRNKFLNVRVDAVLHPASNSAQQVAKEQKDKATIKLGEALQGTAEPKDKIKSTVDVWQGYAAEEAEARHKAEEGPKQQEVAQWQAEVERRRREAEAQRRAEEKTRQKAEEEERLRREAEAEQRRKEQAEAKHREDEQRRQREAEMEQQKAEAERRRAEQHRVREEAEAKSRAEALERRRLRRSQARPLWPPSRPVLVASSLLGFIVLGAFGLWIIAPFQSTKSYNSDQTTESYNSGQKSYTSDQTTKSYNSGQTTASYNSDQKSYNSDQTPATYRLWSDRR